MTRIVLCANNIDELGGAQRVVHTLADGFARRGHDVQVVGITPFEPAHDWHETYPRLVLMSQMWPKKTTQNERTRAALRAEAVAGMVEVLKSGSDEPAIIITAQVWAMEVLADALATVSPAVRARWSVIGQYHGAFAAAASGRDLARVMRSYLNASVFTALTAEDAAAFCEAGLNNVRAMPNPLAFWPQSINGHFAHEKRTLLFLGRLSEEKGVDLLIDAWSLVADDHPNWTLQIVGEGPQGDALRRQASELAGADRIEWRSAVTSPQEILLAADLLALPSRTEGLPLVLAEAQACAVPVVATDCSSGVRQLVGDWGALVPRGDSRVLARALAAAMVDEAWRHEAGQRGRQEMDRYRLDQVLQEWEVLLARVVL